MPNVPIGLNAYKRTDGLVPETKLINLYCEPDKSGISPDGTLRIMRPGLAPLYMLANPVRALGERITSQETIAVAGGSLYANGNIVGSIGGTGIAPMTSTTFTQAIIGGSLLYLYDTTVSAVSLPDGFLAQDVDQLNQYVLVLTSGGSGRFYWIVPGETTVDPLNFATAESSADAAVAICRVGDEFLIFGTQTIEPWQSTGDVDAPFQRVSGRLYERGCLGRDTVKRFDNSVMWVDDQAQVCRLAAVPQVVSDSGLSERIRKRTGSLSAFTFPLDGHEFYVLRIPGQGTFAYDALTQSWCQFASDGDVWRPYVGYDSNGLTIVGDSASGKVWTLAPASALDDGMPIEWTATGTAAIFGKPPRNSSLSAGIGCAEDCTVRLRWRDGQEDYPEYWDILDARAPFDIVSMYRLGQPNQPYRTVELSGNNGVRVRLAGLTANEAWQ